MALSMSLRMPAGAAPAARVAGRRVAPKSVHASARVARVTAAPRAASAASRNVTVAAASFAAVKAPVTGARSAFSGSRIHLSLVSRVSVRRGAVVVQAKKKSVGDLTEADLKGKRVFVRADLNVPFDKELNITDDTRIRAAIPTLKYLVDNGAKVLLTSHLVRFPIVSYLSSSCHQTNSPLKRLIDECDAVGPTQEWPRGQVQPEPHRAPPGRAAWQACCQGR